MHATWKCRPCTDCCLDWITLWHIARNSSSWWIFLLSININNLFLSFFLGGVWFNSLVYPLENRDVFVKVSKSLLPFEIAISNEYFQIKLFFFKSCSFKKHQSPLHYSFLLHWPLRHVVLESFSCYVGCNSPYNPYVGLPLLTKKNIKFILELI